LVSLGTIFGLNSNFDVNGNDVIKIKRKIDNVKKKYQFVNMENVTKIEDIDMMLEKFDIVTTKVDEVVKKFSYYSWFRLPDRSFRLSLTKGEFLQIERNFLNYYEVHFRNRSEEDQGYFRIFKGHSLKEAFYKADNYLRVNRTSQIKLVKRNMRWRHQKATGRQIATLKKHNIDFSDYISKGEASYIIAQLFAKSSNDKNNSNNPTPGATTSPRI
ncbi:MAG: hypothetical protein KAS39_06180, partial [Actinomycetia bacterium]|nr:hypothetical protein [Actinomycetes bacterium]